MDRSILTRLAAVCALTLVISGTAGAAASTMLELLEVLRDNGTISTAAYEALRRTALAEAGGQTDEAAAGAVATPPARAAATAQDAPATVQTRGKLQITSADGAFRWRPIGRVLVDYNLIDSDATKLGSGAELRRARLGMEGRLWRAWTFKAELDFADQEVSAKDVYLGYSGDAWRVRVGHQHVPFGLATMSSSKHTLFIERPLLADEVLQPSRRLGVGAFVQRGERATVHAGVFAGADGEDPDACLTGFDECDEQLSFAARATIVPWRGDAAHLLHLGAGFWYLEPNDSRVRVRQRPGVFHVVDSRFQDLNLGSNAVGDVVALNLEAAAIWGPFSVQAEYSRWDVARTRPAGTAPAAPRPRDVQLEGWYLEGAWFLTGEHMRLETAKAVYGAVKPLGVVGRGGAGAWQLAVRFDSLDLNDPGAGVFAGAQTTASLGLNWYATDTLRLMANYVTVLDLDRPGSVHHGDEPAALLLRAQVYW